MYLSFLHRSARSALGPDRAATRATEALRQGSHSIRLLPPILIKPSWCCLLPIFPFMKQLINFFIITKRGEPVARREMEAKKNKSFFHHQGNSTFFSISFISSFWPLCDGPTDDTARPEMKVKAKRANTSSNMSRLSRG
jgi:hypothetical protein